MCSSDLGKGIYAKISGKNSLSFSLSWETKEEEIVKAVEEVVAAASHLQRVSKEVLA